VQLFPAIDQLMNKCKTHLKYTSHSDHKTFEHEFVLVLEKGPSCSWPYCSWIYNYLCIQCLSPL